MKHKFNTDTETENTPAEAVESKQQPSSTTQKTNTHRVLKVFSPWGEQAADKAAVAASVTPII